MLTELEKKELQNREAELKAKKQEATEKISKIKNDNADRLHAHSNTKKKLILPIILTALSGIAALYSLCGLIISYATDISPVLPIVLFLIFGITCIISALVLKSAIKKKKASSALLSDYTKELADIKKLIAKCDEELKGVQEYFDKDLIEEYFEPYRTGHICIFIGESPFSDNVYVYGYKEPDPAEAKVIGALANNVITFDGLDCSYSRRPFAAIEAAPGTHIVQVSGNCNVPNVTTYYMDTPPEQIKMNEDSIFLFYQWVTWYSSSKGHMSKVYLRKYDNVYDFLKATHQVEDALKEINNS